MKLSEALLCVECDEVFAARENPTGRCPVVVTACREAV